MSGHFSKHLRDAIVINRERMPYYAQQTRGKSRWLSRWMILSEYLCLPLAAWFDRKAEPFNARGVAIVENDFIDMEHILPMHTPPPYTGVATAESRQRVKSTLRQLKADGLRALAADDFQAICRHTAAALTWLSVEEHRQGAGYPMSRHLLESIGYAALNVPGYIGQEAACADLGRRLVGIQLRLVDGGLLNDRWAQQCHARGAGIIVNDVPTIPFLEAYQEPR